MPNDPESPEVISPGSGDRRDDHRWLDVNTDDDPSTLSESEGTKPFWPTLRRTLWAKSWAPWLRLMGTVIILATLYVIIRVYGV